MKRILFLVAAVFIVIILVAWLCKRETDGFDENLGSTHKKSKDKSPQTLTQESWPMTHLKNDKEITRENEQLLATFHKAASDNDSEGFRLALSGLLSKKYEGEPRIFIGELIPYLDHPNKEIRFELAKMFIWMGLENNKAIDALLAILVNGDENPAVKKIPGQPGETYTKNLRKSAAKLLTMYRIIQSKEPLWGAYLQTSDRSYLRCLSVFRDERASKEALKLVNSGQAKYIDLHEIFGAFKVKESAVPLDAIFRSRIERKPGENQSNLAWSLYQITEGKQYYEYLVDRQFYLANAAFGGPDVLQVLEKTLIDDDGSDLNAKGNNAFLSLLARKDGREVLENYLVEVFNEKIKSPLDATLRYRVAAYLDSERVNAAVERYEAKYGNGLWLHYSKRKGWPVNDLIDGYIY